MPSNGCRTWVLSPPRIHGRRRPVPKTLRLANPEAQATPHVLCTPSCTPFLLALRLLGGRHRERRSCHRMALRAPNAQQQRTAQKALLTGVKWLPLTLDGTLWHWLARKKMNRPRWDSNPRITDLQSVPLVHLGTRPRFIGCCRVAGRARTRRVDSTLSFHCQASTNTKANPRWLRG